MRHRAGVRHRVRHLDAWLSWLFGAAMLAALIAAAFHYSEQRAFVHLAERARPWWLLGAVFLQAGTYLAQGAIWRQVAERAGATLSRRTAFELGLAKLFADQTLPSAGVSSSVLVARALEQRHLPQPAVRAAVLVNITSYHLAYVFALAPALAIIVAKGTNAIVTGTAIAFLLLSLFLSGVIVAFAGREHPRVSATLDRFRAARTTLAFVSGADARLVRSARLLARTTGLQLAIVLLDATTLWVLIRAAGSDAPPGGVFASFMIASLFRTMGIVPGGLGTFEATSVVTLRMFGLDLAAALSATLLFRGLSFWLPMLPGYWCSRRAIAARPAGADHAAATE